MASIYGTSPWTNSSLIKRLESSNGLQYMLQSCISLIQLCRPTDPRQWGAASVVIYVPAVSLTKVSILIFYLRINPTSKFRYQVFFVLFFTIGSLIALCFALIFECHPIAKFWDPLIEGKCVDVAGLYLANGILNVIADFLVLLVPIPMLVTLHVSTRHKVILAGVFAAGSSCVGPLLHSRWFPEISNSPSIQQNLYYIRRTHLLYRQTPQVRRHLPCRRHPYLPRYSRN